MTGGAGASDRDWRIFERLPYGVVVHQEQGRILFANQPAANLFGVALADDLVGRQITDLFTPPYLKGLRASLVTPDGEDPEPVHERLLRPDGRVVEVEVTAVPFVAEEEGRVQLSFHDIGPRLRAHALERNEWLLRLAGGVAHELNNALSAIRSRASVLQSSSRAGSGIGGAVVPPEWDEDLAAIVSASQSASLVTERLLGYARGGSYRRRVIDVASLVRKVVARARGDAPAGVTIAVELATAPLAVEGDETQLVSVLEALFDNALEAHRPGGQVTLRTGPVDLAPEELPEDPSGDKVRHAGGVKRAFVHIEVEDDGAGMSSEVLARAFEPYFSTRAVGRGLGLAMVHGIVRHHDGFVRIDSTIGGPTCAHLWLPSLPASVASVAVPNRGKRKVRPTGRGRVLLVDDDAQVRSAVRRVLIHLGYDVVEAASGEDALALCAAGGLEPYACVLLDMQMPGMGGAEVLHRLRELWPLLPVLVATGYHRDEVVAELLTFGHVGFVRKPFEVSELGLQIEGLLGQRALEPEL